MRYFIHRPHRGRPDRLGNSLARTLGIISLLLGAFELVAAEWLANSLGLEGYTWLLIAYGGREMLTGLIVLIMNDAAPGIWLRVFGDAIDVATLAWGFMRDPADRIHILLATAIVSPVVILDIYSALRLKRGSRRPLEPIGNPA